MIKAAKEWHKMEMSKAPSLARFYTPESETPYFGTLEMAAMDFTNEW